MICPLVKEGNVIRGNNYTWNLRTKVSCNTRNVIYMIECNKEKCNQRYIGQSKREFRLRMSQHKGYVINKELSQPTGYHFNSPGHNISNMTVTIVEKS